MPGAPGPPEARTSPADDSLCPGNGQRPEPGSGLRNEGGGGRVSARRALTNQRPVVTNGSHRGRAMSLFTMRIFIVSTKAPRVRRME